MGECVGYAPVLINSAAAQDDMEKIMRSHCRTVKVAGLAVFAVAEIDGEWGLKMRCVSGHFGDSLFIECTLGVFPALAFVADFLPVAPQFHQRTHRVRLRNWGTTDKKSSHKIKHKKIPRVH